MLSQRTTLFAVVLAVFVLPPTESFPSGGATVSHAVPVAYASSPGGTCFVVETYCDWWNPKTPEHDSVEVPCISESVKCEIRDIPTTTTTTQPPTPNPSQNQNLDPPPAPVPPTPSTTIPPAPTPEPTDSDHYGPGEGPIWLRLADCESGDGDGQPPLTANWAYNGSSGYDGGIQFSPSTWRSAWSLMPPEFRQEHKPDNPDDAGFAFQFSSSVQISVGQRWLAETDWGQWPSCSRKLGLR